MEFTRLTTREWDAKGPWWDGVSYQKGISKFVLRATKGYSTMSFFSPPAAALTAQALKPVEGFHPDDSSTPGSSTTTTAGNSSPFGDLFSMTMTWGGTTTTTIAYQHQQHHGFDLPDPFPKFPSSVNVAAAANVEFNDELSLLPSSSPATAQAQAAV